MSKNVFSGCSLKILTRRFLDACVLRRKTSDRTQNVVDVTVKFIGGKGKAPQEKAVALATWLRSPGLFLKGPLQMERAKGRKNLGSL